MDNIWAEQILSVQLKRVDDPKIHFLIVYTYRNIAQTQQQQMGPRQLHDEAWSCESIQEILG